MSSLSQNQFTSHMEKERSEADNVGATMPDDKATVGANSL